MDIIDYESGRFFKNFFKELFLRKYFQNLIRRNCQKQIYSWLFDGVDVFFKYFINKVVIVYVFDIEKKRNFNLMDYFCV